MCTHTQKETICISFKRWERLDRWVSSYDLAALARDLSPVFNTHITHNPLETPDPRYPQTSTLVGRYRHRNMSKK